MNPDEQQPSETVGTYETVEVTNENPDSMLNSFITGEDTIMILGTLVVITCFAFIINRLIVFVSEFMRDFVKRIKNNSMIYSDNYLNKTDLDTNLDRSEFGLKTILDRWF